MFGFQKEGACWPVRMGGCPHHGGFSMAGLALIPQLLPTAWTGQVQGLYSSDPKDIPPQQYPVMCPDVHHTLGKGNGVVMVSYVLPQNSYEVTQHKV